MMLQSRCRNVWLRHLKGQGLKQNKPDYPELVKSSLIHGGVEFWA